MAIRSSSSAWVSAGERAAAHQQLIKHRTEAVNVAAAIHAMPFTPRLFGAHVEGCPGEARAMTKVLVPQGQTEIDEVRPVVVVNAGCCPA